MPMPPSGPSLISMSKIGVDEKLGLSCHVICPGMNVDIVLEIEGT